MTRRRKRLLLLLPAFVTAFGFWVRCGPLPAGFLDPERHLSTQVFDRHGELLYESLSELEGRSRWLAPDRLPETLVRATLAAEDRRFFGHPGVDPLAVVRAAWHNLRAHRVLEGGSTLTQQVVKRLSGRRKTLPGKLTEMLQALRLEHRLSKKGILALYLNLAPYGNQYVGAESASRGYFGCAPENLTSAQAAFLAGLPQKPSSFDPYRQFSRAFARQQWVLSRMEALGFLSKPDTARARVERLRLVHADRVLSAPHFVQRVLASFSSSAPRRVETTLDAPLQREVQGILKAQREKLRAHGAHNVAVAVLANDAAEWLAWEGSGDYFDEQNGGAIDGVTASRQPGSALKPFTYALAFERGVTPASVLPDVPSHFPTAAPGILYAPRNYDGVFRGPLRARAALAGSENVPAVWLLSQVGVPDLLRLLRSTGLRTLDRKADVYGYALTMGDAEVRLSELVTAYSIFARGGIRLRPTMVRSFIQADGSAQASPRPREERVLSERASFWIADILSDSRARAYAFGSGGSLDFPFPVAVKTGTSQGYHDNWTIGFTRRITVGVWVGNFDRTELKNSSGVTGAAPIFHAVLEAAEKRVAGRLPNETDPTLAEPSPGLLAKSICSLSGLLATEACPSVESEWLPAGGGPSPCAWHRRHGSRVAVAWPSEYRAWARGRGLLTAPQAFPHAERASAPLRIQNPPPRAIYLRDPTLRSQYQTLPLRAIVDVGPRRLSWRVDGRSLGAVRSDDPFHWPLEPGDHTITVADDRGLRDETTILVK